MDPVILTARHKSMTLRFTSQWSIKLNVAKLTIIVFLLLNPETYAQPNEVHEAQASISAEELRRRSLELDEASTRYARLSAWASLVQTGGVIVSLAFVVISLRIEHRRRRLEATHQYSQGYSFDDRRLVNEIVGLPTDPPLDADKVDAIIKDPDRFAKTRQVLAQLEHLATAANRGVYDIGMINDMQGYYLLRLYNQLHAYMQNRISDSRANLRAFDQFEQLAKTLANMRGVGESFTPLNRNPQARS